MELTGRIVDLAQDFATGKFKLTMEVNEGSVIKSHYDEAKRIETLDIKLDKHKKKRSLDANSYFHVLVGKIADKQNISKPAAKNILLGKYGQRETIDDKPVIISVMTDIDMMEREDIHTIAIGYGNAGGKEFTHYAVIRGSHTYDTKEMSVLIDGTVNEAKGMGIQTITPDDLERMKSTWGN